MQLSCSDLQCRQRTQTTKVKVLKQYLSQSSLNTLQQRILGKILLKTDSMLKCTKR